MILTQSGFRNVQLHDVDEPKLKRPLEQLLEGPGEVYCRRKAAAADTAEERDYWTQAGSKQSLYGRWLVVTAQR
ncbi:hypothetical protein [Achromobacter animicus]|uniref:hypothetical protein n=1 Tax=Achromobacter animicus TaxID=1389935 RepID=UPI00244AF716|nr:hypothetical protein [Achromobacter animicus]MDH0682742.1 hypothetical protein [Achromobacter animicus]